MPYDVLVTPKHEQEGSGALEQRRGKESKPQTHTRTNEIWSALRLEGSAFSRGGSGNDVRKRA